jgi:hypothetical protein
MPGRNRRDRGPFGRDRDDDDVRRPRRDDDFPARRIRQVRATLVRVADGISNLLRVIEALDGTPEPPPRRRFRDGDRSFPRDLWRALDDATDAVEHALHRLQALRALRPPRGEPPFERRRPNGFRRRRDRDEDRDEDNESRDLDDNTAKLGEALSRLRRSERPHTAD